MNFNYNQSNKHIAYYKNITLIRSQPL